MKLAFSTLGCPDLTLMQAIRTAAQLGFQGIEIRGIGNHLHARDIEELCGEKKERSLRYAKENGITFCCLGASASFHEKEKQKENMDEALETVRLASACGIPYVRVFGNSLTESDENTQIADVANQLRLLCTAAKPTNVHILLEVHGDFNTSERILKTASLVGCDNFGIIWDIKHSTDEPAEFWKNTKHLIRHIHLKDSTQNGLCSFGEGTLGVEKTVRMIAEDGYDGFFSLEWEKRWHPQLRDAAAEFPHFVRKMKEILQNG